MSTQRKCDIFHAWNRFDFSAQKEKVNREMATGWQQWHLILFYFLSSFLLIVRVIALLENHDNTIAKWIVTNAMLTIACQRLIQVQKIVNRINSNCTYASNCLCFWWFDFYSAKREEKEMNSRKKKLFFFINSKLLKWKQYVNNKSTYWRFNYISVCQLWFVNQ